VTEGLKETFNPCDRHRAGDPCDLPLPAGLARDAHPLLAVPVSLVARLLSSRWSASRSIRFDVRIGAGIGLVVDDAIVSSKVYNATSRKVLHQGRGEKAMEELSSPVIGIALVLSSVFVPTALIPGITEGFISSLL